jgi:hypothetical protein
MDLSEQQEGGRLSVWPLRRRSLSPANPPLDVTRQGPRLWSLEFYKDLLDSAVRGLESLLRRRDKVYEFTADPTCIFRLGPGIAEDELTLADGTRIQPSDPILGLHFWNEHLPPIPRNGPCISWGLAMHGQVLHSLRMLAAHLESDEDAYHGIKALRGEASFGSRIGRLQMYRVAERYGFELFPGTPPLARRFRFFWENFLIWGLIWTYNRGGMRGKKLMKERFELWYSRDELIRRHGTGRSEPKVPATRDAAERRSAETQAAPPVVAS